MTPGEAAADPIGAATDPVEAGMDPIEAATDPVDAAGRRRARLLALIGAAWTTQAIRAACALGLPARLASGACGADALAAATACHAPSLRRLLRALASLGLCAERDDGDFELTVLGRMLDPGDARSLHAWAMLCGSPATWQRWAELEHSVRSGASWRRRHGGTDGFEHLAGDRETATQFHRAMTEVTRGVAADVLGTVDLSRARRVVDVGGGFGGLLAAILMAHPRTRGVLFDLPHAIEGGAREALERAGVAARCECVAGSFFDAVPAGGDTYLLKSVLHDWDDERSVAILRHCRRAMPGGARLLLIERIAAERTGASARDRAVARSDLNMLVSLGGRERTAAELGALLAAAGLRTERVVVTGGELDVIEAVAA